MVFAFTGIEAKKSRVIWTDDTAVRILDRTLKKRTRTGRIWVYRGDAEHPYIVFRFTTSRERAGPRDHLENFRGFLHADAFSGYDCIFVGGGVTEVACFAHARRKFVAAMDSSSSAAAQILLIIQELYNIERDHKGSTADERLKARQERSIPLLDELKEMLDRQSLMCLPKSNLAKAINYTRNQWDALNTFTTCGDLTIDNNLAKNALRPIAIGRLNPNGTQTLVVGGTKTTGNVLTLSVYDAGLTSGLETLSYTVLAADTLTTIATAIAAAANADTNLQAIGVTATSSSTVVNLKSTSINATTYAQTTSSGATEILTLATGTGVTQALYNELNQLINRSPGGAVNFQGTTNKAVKSVTANSQVVNIEATPPKSPFLTTYAAQVSNIGEYIYVYNNFRGSTSLSIGGYGPFTGAVYTITVTNPDLPNGVEYINYTTLSTDTYATITTAINAAINADLNLRSIGLSSTDNPTAGTIAIATNFPTYTTSTSGGSTETLSVGTTDEGRSSVTVAGAVTAGDVLSIVTHYPSLTGTGQQETVSYTVLSTDTLPSIATALSAALNADTNLQALDLTSSSQAAAQLTSSESFTVSPTLAAGASTTVVSAIDGGSNTKSNNYQISTKGAANQTLTYDLNGNMTNDGTNSYQAE